MTDLIATMGFDPRAKPWIIDWWFMRDGSRIAILSWLMLLGLGGYCPEEPGTKHLQIYNTKNGHSINAKLWKSFG